MELWLFQLPSQNIFLVISGLIGALSVFAVFMKKQNSQEGKKVQANKALLKQLLEGFGLEVPAELNETAGAVIESSKTH